MLTYKDHFSSQRPDGRHVSTMAAYMARLREMKPELSLPAELTPEIFREWQEKVSAKYLALSEGGPDELLAVVKRAYAAAGKPDHLVITHYPACQDPAVRTKHGPLPLYGLSKEEFYKEWCYCLSEDHSFRGEAALDLLRTAFKMKQQAPF